MSSSIIVINEIEELLNEMNDELISSINTINTKTANTTDVSAIKTNTNTNNTESSSGTLSQKLSYLINRRDRIITPSNNNLKTFETSKSIEATGVIKDYTYETTSGYNSVTYSTYIKYSGIYRIYVTFSTTKVNNTFDHINCKDGETETHYVDLIVSVDEYENVKTIEDTIYGYFDTGISSTTKTFDVFCTSGCYLKIVIKLASIASYDICGGVCYAAKHRLDISDVSVRGTINELNNAMT